MSDEFENEITNLNANIDDLENKIEKLDEELNNSECENSTFRDEVAELQEIIDNSEKADEMQNVYHENKMLYNYLKNAVNLSDDEIHRIIIGVKTK
ncbi:hypothetical protein COB55_03120 [Candidatus Wolfebacteria bacterium]|nr:MAG: hypothetical protein COB55_03120 [Candidatus Wolfebacteria bacterium]